MHNHISIITDKNLMLVRYLLNLLSKSHGADARCSGKLKEGRFRRK